MNLDQIAELLIKSDSILLTTHESPDGDGMGAQVALYRGLTLLGKNVSILNSDPMEKRYYFIDPEKCVKSVREGEKRGGVNELKKTTLFIIDSHPDNVGKPLESIKEGVETIAGIDHHPYEEVPDNFYVDAKASSTCEIAYELLKKWEAPIDTLSAQALYCGLIYDTGSFAHANTTLKTLEAGRDMVSLGANPSEIYQNLFYVKSLSAIKVQARLIETMELFKDDRIALLSMSRELFSSEKVTSEDIKEVVNLPLQSQQIELSILVKEKLPHVWSCSLRSKGDIDCRELAKQFGGGGHYRASGFRFNGEYSELKRSLLEKMGVSCSES